MNTDQENEQDPRTEEILRQADILRRGISNEAIDLLEQVFGYHHDIFQLVDRHGVPRRESADILMMEAQKRDGALSVIRWIKQRRNNKLKAK